MSVRIPSDLLVSVMQAADPQRLRAAQARLTGTAAEPDAAARGGFAALLAGPPQRARDLTTDLVADVMAAADPDRLTAANAQLGAAGTDTATMLAWAVPASDSYAKFEGFLLRSAFEDILPPASSGAFGDGYAGGVWRSMAAEQFANLFADRGGIGVAQMLRDRSAAKADAAAGAPAVHGQWPYFEMPKLSSFAA